MKVKELIEVLSQLDPELMVVVRGYEGGVNEVKKCDLCNVLLNANSEWYYGKHEKLSDKELEKLEKYKDSTIVKRVQLI